jgi:hypothetical protein
MVRLAALLAFCLYCAYVWIPTNPDQSTGATTPARHQPDKQQGVATNPDQSTGATAPKGVTATQISAEIEAAVDWEVRHADSSDRRHKMMQYPKSLLIKMWKVEKLLPQWIEKNGIFEVMDDYEKLQNAYKEDRRKEAENAADAILKSMESEDRGE